MLKFLRAKVLPMMLGVCLMGAAGISAAADSPVLDRFGPEDERLLAGICEIYVRSLGD